MPHKRGKRCPESRISKGRIRSKERMLKAMEMRKKGHTLEEIAEKLDYAGPTSAHKAISSILEQAVNRGADEYRALEVARYETLLKKVWPGALRGDKEKIDQALKILTRLDRIHSLEASVVVDAKVNERKEVVIRYVNNWRDPSPGSIAAGPPSGADGSTQLELPAHPVGGGETVEKNHNGNGESH